MDDYPPEFDGPDYCLVCGKWIGTGEPDCVCPECPVCASVGDPDCYGTHMPKDNRAFSIEDLAQHLGAAHDDAASIARRLFKDTRCGISFNAEPGRVSVAGYAEGAGDASCEPIFFDFPIDLDAFDKGVEQADDEGCTLFEEFHCSVCGCEVGYEETCPEWMSHETPD